MQKAHNKQATWGGRFTVPPSELMLRFSESVSFDQRLASFDVLGSKAHAAMLCAIGILDERDRDAICAGLDRILEQIERQEFEWDARLEDVHMNIEQALTALVPAAARLHTGRSRNDQVATDMRLFLKDACREVDHSLRELMHSLVSVASANQDVIIPGYTHMQRAQPVSAAHHLLAYVEMFSRDRERFAQIADRANWCPLGVGAIAGSTLPIDREFTARALGFVDADGMPRVTRNSMDTVADRDLYLEFAMACALCGAHFSRVAEDLILWNTTEFGFVSLPDAFTTGSSLMPQKKNPDSLELLRGKSARLQGNATALLSMVKGLPLTYNRDLQEDKPPVFDSFDQTVICLQVLAGTIAEMTFRRERCKSAVEDPLLLATDVADYLVEHGVPFRDAHHAVGKLVALAERRGVPLREIPLEDANAISPAFEADWTNVFDLQRALARREGPGMPGPNRVAAEIARWQREL